MERGATIGIKSRYIEWARLARYCRDDSRFRGTEPRVYRTVFEQMEDWRYARPECGGEGMGEGGGQTGSEALGLQECDMPSRARADFGGCSHLPFVSDGFSARRARMGRHTTKKGVAPAHPE
jgi:hypothetical protein